MRVTDDQLIAYLDGGEDDPLVGETLARDLGARLVGLDVFDQPSTCGKLGDKLLAGYALDALSEPADQAFNVPDPSAVQRLLADLASGEVQSYPAIGAGTDLRFSGRDCVGGGLLVDGTLVHLAASPGEARQPGAGPQGFGPGASLRRRRFVARGVKGRHREIRGKLGW